MTDAERLAKAEWWLTELTDQCCGSCHWNPDGPIDACPCDKVFFPAIERIRELRKREAP